MSRSALQCIAAAFLSLTAALVPAFAEVVAIDGYSPVSYFTKSIAEKGRPEFSAQYEGQTYYLASQKQLELFTADPKAFAPKFGAFCAFSLKTGMTQRIDPTSFKIVGGSLLLFHYSEGKDARAEWEKGNEQDQLKQAEANFTLLRF